MERYLIECPLGPLKMKEANLCTSLKYLRWKVYLNLDYQSKSTPLDKMFQLLSTGRSHHTNYRI
jgi:hypothetical protein